MIFPQNLGFGLFTFLVIGKNIFAKGQKAYLEKNRPTDRQIFLYFVVTIIMLHVWEGEKMQKQLFLEVSNFLF